MVTHCLLVMRMTMLDLNTKVFELCVEVHCSKSFELLEQCLNLHTRSDWMTDPSLPKKLNIFKLFDRAEGSSGTNGSTMHCASVPIQSQWGSVNGRRQWARGVRLVQSACVCQWMTRVCLTYRVLVFVLQPIKSLPATKPMCGYGYKRLHKQVT